MSRNSNIATEVYFYVGIYVNKEVALAPVRRENYQ